MVEQPVCGSLAAPAGGLCARAGQLPPINLSPAVVLVLPTWLRADLSVWLTAAAAAHLRPWRGLRSTLHMWNRLLTRRLHVHLRPWRFHVRRRL